MKSQSQDNVRKASREKTSCFRDCVPSPLHYYDLSARPLFFLTFSLLWDPGGASSSPRSIEQDINSCIVSVSLVGCWCGDILTLQTKVCMLSIPQPATTCPESMSSIVDRTSLDGGSLGHSSGPYMLRACTHAVTVKCMCKQYPCTHPGSPTTIFKMPAYVFKWGVYHHPKSTDNINWILTDGWLPRCM